MELLQSIILENELTDIKNVIIELHRKYYSEVKKLSEGILDFDKDDLGHMFEEAQKRFLAAHRAIRIANKLNDPEQKKRVWGNFNQLRAFVKRLDKMIAEDLEALQQQIQGNQQPMMNQRPVSRTPTEFGRNQSQMGANTQPAPAAPRQQVPQQ